MGLRVSNGYIEQGWIDATIAALIVCLEYQRAAQPTTLLVSTHWLYTPSSWLWNAPKYCRVNTHLVGNYSQ